jgi:hypothetical protein
MAVHEDVGMAVKMHDKCFADICLLHAGERIEERPIHSLVNFVNQRHDCADFRLLCLIHSYLAYGDLLTPTTIRLLESCILGFKYWMDEPGEDGMCYWSENHQIIFAACEYLAGQTFPDRVFTNNGASGSSHREKAKTRILRWLSQRFSYGFSEWHSNTYYEEDIAPLCALVDHARDPEIVRKATIILDLLFLDMALHSFNGYFMAASGRCYENQKKDGKSTDVNDILAQAFGILTHKPDYRRLSAIYLLRRNYRVPDVIRSIAHATGSFVIKDSMGLDLAEVVQEFPVANFEQRGMFLWAMEAFTNQQSIELTMDIFNAWKLQHNNFLRDLRMVNIPLLRRLRLLPLVLRILNPATQGVAIQRANTCTYRGASYMLSSAQKYHPGEFGDQQHIWHAALPDNINIFSTHPGSPMFDDPARNFSPGYWVGNGINPHAVQDRNILLLMYNLRQRGGFLERTRQRFVHFYFPVARFDEVRRDTQLIMARKTDSYLAILSTQPYTLHHEDELIYQGDRCCFAVIMGDRATFGSFRNFMTQLQSYNLNRRGNRLICQADRRLEVVYRGEFSIDGLTVDTAYPRLDTPFVSAPRKPQHLDIIHDGMSLHLDFDRMVRQGTGVAIHE